MPRIFKSSPIILIYKNSNSYSLITHIMSVKVLPLDRRLNNPYIKSWFLVPKNSFRDYKLKTSSKNKTKTIGIHQSIMKSRLLWTKWVV